MKAASDFLICEGQRADSLVSVDSFEEAGQLAAAGMVTYAIVPAAYRGFNELIYGYAGRLHYSEILYSTTPEFILAGREGGPAPRMDVGPISIASHASPAPLSRSLAFPVNLINVSSNVAAAEAVRDWRAEFCITQMAALAAINGDHQTLKVIKTFGSFEMLWAVLQRRDAYADARPVFRRFPL